MFKKNKQLSNSQLLDQYRQCMTETEILKIELQETKLALDAAYSVLQNVTEPDLIDSAIYEFNSIQKKYTFLHKKFLELSI